jgi:2-polyprenyl-3-methyl-5-hydroxy-6-metoxy-1,4-benzoquinol methylase
MPDFDYQWKNLPSRFIEYNEDRVNEFLKFTGLDRDALKGKICLDAGCGNGRYTYAMQKLGAARVESFDISPEAVSKCRQINPAARVVDIANLSPDPSFDFVLCWGVLNHIAEPRSAFARVSSQVKDLGMLHIMVYHRDTQRPYEEGRKKWPNLALDEKLAMCEEMAKTRGGDVHGWFDAFNPTYNWSFHEKEPKRWFKEEGFEKVRLVTKHNINMNGRKV